MRISTHLQLVQPRPGQRQGATSYVLDLLYRPLSDCFGSLVADGRVVRLGYRADVDPNTCGEIARSPVLVQERQTEDGLELIFQTESVADSLSLQDRWLNGGAYRFVEIADRTLRLARRIPGPGPRRIEVVSMRSEDEEWRRFMAKEVDVLMSATPMQLEQLTQIPSVYQVPIQNDSTVAWLFRMQGPLADARLRRALAMAVDRKSLATTLVGDSAQAVSVHEDLDEAKRILAELGISRDSPIEIPVLIYEGATQWQRLGLILQQQLRRFGVHLALETASIAEITKRVRKGDWSSALLPGGYEPRHYATVLTNSAANITGYRNQELDAAARTGDHERARRILEADVPLTPLFKECAAVALNRRFCGVAPEYPFDWSWLAHVHPCEESDKELAQAP